MSNEVEADRDNSGVQRGETETGRPSSFPRGVCIKSAKQAARANRYAPTTCNPGGEEEGGKNDRGTVAWPRHSR